MLKRTLLTLVLPLVLLLPCRGWAWGCTGHEVVALIALHRLDSKTRVSLDHVLSTLDRKYPGRFCSDIDLPAAAHFASWADDYRTRHQETADWHYWDIPLENPSAAAGQFCENGCVVRAISEQLAIMKDTSKSQEQRVDALLFLLHFVGDIHQPLHAEDNEDRGGNCVPVGFLDKPTEPRLQNGKPTANYTPNLHGIWDTDLVETIGNVATRNQQSVTAFADDLDRRYAKDRKAWKKESDPVKWALESHQVAKSIYRSLPSRIAPVHYTHQIGDCSENGTSAKYAGLHETVDAAYVASRRTRVEKQLAAAGVRLASLLTANWPADWQ